MNNLAEAVVALDANGADLGPGEVAAGAALAAQRGARVLLFGPASQLSEVPAGVEVIDAPLSIAKSPDPARAARPWQHLEGVSRAPLLERPRPLEIVEFAEDPRARDRAPFTGVVVGGGIGVQHAPFD